MSALIEQLEICLRAKFSLILLVTHEELRALDAIRQVCGKTELRFYDWDISGGGSLPIEQGLEGDPLSALKAVKETDEKALFVLKDFHDCWSNDVIKRNLKSICQNLKYKNQSILVTAPARNLPEELKDECTVIDLPPPTEPELTRIFEEMAQNAAVDIKLTSLGIQKIVQAALGLSTAQAERTFLKEAITANGVLDDQAIDRVNKAKKTIIRENEALEYYSVTETAADVGGLGALKQWLNTREKAFSRKAKEYGLPTPKGIALIGIPGTGKSLTAKMIGNLWRLPLLRLDVGSLFGSLVGESEERTRRALKVAETVAPCVVWIDEIEKALSTGGHDGGTSQRVFGTILTWMQEKTSPCFVVATANDISRIPPELLRRGRFDEIFFLDLPTAKERTAILHVHIKKRKRFIDDYDVERLTTESRGYVGAEIEQAVNDAMYAAFADGVRDFTTDDISAALERQIPLSRSQQEVIDDLRSWLKEGRAQSASFDDADDAEGSFVVLE